MAACPYTPSPGATALLPQNHLAWELSQAISMLGWEPVAALADLEISAHEAEELLGKLQFIRAYSAYLESQHATARTHN